MTQSTPTQLRMYRPNLDDAPPVRPLPDGYEIRVANGEQDERDLAVVLTAAFGEEWTSERVRASLTQVPDVLAVYVVSQDGRLVATAASRWDPETFPETGYVHWVGALPDQAGRGLGAALMARLLEDFRDRGYKAAVLETDDFRLPAIKVYLQFGYVPVYEVKGEDHRARWSAAFQAIFGRSNDGRSHQATHPA